MEVELQLQKYMNYQYYDILESAVSKWFGSTAHILASLKFSFQVVL